MHKNATKCNETLNKWCKNKHGASKIMDTLETYQLPTIYGMQKVSVAYVGAVVSLKGSRHPNRAMGPLLGPQVEVL
jgi:hypothetical protein